MGLYKIQQLKLSFSKMRQCFNDKASGKTSQVLTAHAFQNNRGDPRLAAAQHWGDARRRTHVRYGRRPIPGAIRLYRRRRERDRRYPPTSTRPRRS